MNTLVNIGGTTTADVALRHCALSLHAIAAQDRAWVLARLTGPRRGELERLIDELDSLGIQPDAQLAQAAIHGRRPKTPRVALLDRVTARSDTRPAVTTHEDAAEVARILGTEAPALIVQVLRGRNAAFRAAFLSCFEPARRAILSKRLELNLALAEDPPPRLSEALREEIDGRRESMAPLRPRSLAQHWRSGWRRLEALLS